GYATPHRPAEVFYSPPARTTRSDVSEKLGPVVLRASSCAAQRYLGIAVPRLDRKAGSSHPMSRSTGRGQAVRGGRISRQGSAVRVREEDGIDEAGRGAAPCGSHFGRRGQCLRLLPQV